MAKRKPQSMKQQLLPQIGARCECSRCGRECQVAAGRNEDAQMLRYAAAPRGYCVDCAVTHWLAEAYPCNEIIETSEQGPSMLLVPQIQEQFASIMRVANADAKPEDIN